MSQLARENPDNEAMQSLPGQREHFAQIADLDDGVRCGNDPSIGCSGCRDCGTGHGPSEPPPAHLKMPGRQADDGNLPDDEAA